MSKIIYKIFIIIFIVSLCTIILSLFKIITWYVFANTQKKNIDLVKNTISNNLSNNYDNMEATLSNNNLISIDFSILKEINDDTIGWLKIENTNIDYPVVQNIDNIYYLKHTFDKSYNKGGWIFLDYRNKNDFSNKNNIIYGHNRQNGTMFGSLANILKEEWLNNLNNHLIKVITPNNYFVWQIFSIYYLPKTSDYLQTNFSNKEFDQFLKLITKRSIYEFTIEVFETDHILTISTCYSQNSRLVVHAKLVNELY